MIDYRKVNVTHHLSSYEVILPIWNGNQPILKPFEPWKIVRKAPKSNDFGLGWYRAYNASKHDRQDDFKKANLENLLMAIAGLQVLISSQFANQDFSSGSTLLVISGHSYHPMEPCIGGLFRIKYPDDWLDSELYDFDWSLLVRHEERFAQINYDAIRY